MGYCIKVSARPLKHFFEHVQQLDASALVLIFCTRTEHFGSHSQESHATESSDKLVDHIDVKRRSGKSGGICGEQPDCFGLDCLDSLGMCMVSCWCLDECAVVQCTCG